MQDRKTESITIRLSAGQKEKLLAMAQNNYVSVSQYILNELGLENKDVAASVAGELTKEIALQNFKLGEMLEDITKIKQALHITD